MLYQHFLLHFILYFKDDAVTEKVREDFEIGQILRDQVFFHIKISKIITQINKVVPRAVLFFTGEAAEDDMFDEFDEDEEEDDENEGGAQSSGSDEEE